MASAEAELAALRAECRERAELWPRGESVTHPMVDFPVGNAQAPPEGSAARRKKLVAKPTETTTGKEETAAVRVLAKKPTSKSKGRAKGKVEDVRGVQATGPFPFGGEMSFRSQVTRIARREQAVAAVAALELRVETAVDRLAALTPPPALPTPKWLEHGLGQVPKPRPTRQPPGTNAHSNPQNDMRIWRLQTASFDPGMMREGAASVDAAACLEAAALVEVVKEGVRLAIRAATVNADAEQADVHVREAREAMQRAETLLDLNGRTEQ